MKKSGFSLIELLMVIGIIGILSMLAVPSYDRYINRARVQRILVIGESYKARALDALSDGNEVFKAMHAKPLDIVDKVILDLVNDEYMINVHADLNNLKLRSKGKNLIVRFIGKTNVTQDFLTWECGIQHEYAEYAKQCKAMELE